MLDMGYHSQGGLAVLNATGVYGSVRKRMFSQFLGYENKAYGAPGVPALLSPKYDGSISQQVYKYTSDMNAVKPVRAVNYGYDQLNRMRTALGYVNTNANPLDAQEKIDSLNLAMMANDTLSTRMDYDLNGRISGQRTGGVASVDSAKYYYPTNSYELDRVVGKLSAGSTRSLASAGTLGYDYNGAMIEDKSKKLEVRYGWDGLPVSQTVDSAQEYGAPRCCVFRAKKPLSYSLRYRAINYYHFYDADGNRVSRIQTESGPEMALNGSHYVVLGGQSVKEWDERYYQSGLVRDPSAIVSIVGMTAQIGRIRQGSIYEFFLKNHQGSTMYTVDDRGRYNTGTQRAYDYLVFGSNKLLKTGADTTDVRQKWTGKELELATGLYAFGARWYDPELAMWTTSDPAREFFNPYSYVGGNPSNRMDPTGMMSFWDGVLSVLGTVATNVAGGVACFYSGGNACVFGYYNNETGESYTVGGGLGPWGAWAGDTRANWRTKEFQTRGGAGTLHGPVGLPIGGTWNFGRTRKDNTFFTLDITFTADFDTPHGSNGSSTVDDNSLQPVSPPQWDLSEEDQVFLENQKLFARAAFLLYYADLTAQGAYWQEEEGNGSLEPGFIDRDGTIIGPFRGTIDNYRGVSTLGGNFAHLLREGDVVVHGHTRDAMKAKGYYNGLSGWVTNDHSVGDFGSLVGNRLKGIYAYEPSSKRLYYSNLSLTDRFGPAYNTPANLYIGSWDYHSVARRSVDFPSVKLPLKAK